MKIEILTFSKEINYGAEMQSYALMKTLQSEGHDVSFIDIQLAPIQIPIYSKLFHLPNILMFQFFWNTKIGCFTRKYKTANEIISNPPLADIYIVGSDQVWNPEITNRLDPLVYFFNFLPDGAKRISYAASFGFDNWTDELLKPEVKRLLGKFSAISVREKKGIDICKQTFGINATLVCDPTQLISNYDDICGEYDESKESENILYWKQRRNINVENAVCDAADKLQKKVISICDFHWEKRCRNKPIVSIKSWINNIRYANFIVTDSFHCLSFCLIYHKQFAIIYEFEDRSNRIINLLEYLDLRNRFFTSINELRDNIQSLYNNPIDYKKVDEKMNIVRKSSIKFLRKSIID